MTIDVIHGAEAREAIGAAVFTFSAIRRTTEPVRFTPLLEKALRFRGLYTRPHEIRDGVLWDVISAAPMATDFAITRFLLPWLSDADFVIFADGSDMLFLDDPFSLFCLADRKYAVQVVKRDWTPTETVKMDAQIQTAYPRKGWSSLMIWNRTHPANEALTLEDVNCRPGRDLHRFYWLADDEVGELPLRWNLLSGVDPTSVADLSTIGRPGLVHFTKGLPTMAGHENDPWAPEWRRELAILDSTRGGIRVPHAA
jgi:hypothetical protein